MAEQCCKKIRIAGSMMPRYKQCTKKASVDVDGSHYCGIHNPVARKARQEKRDDEADKARQQRMKTMRLHRAAPELLEALYDMTQWVAAFAYGQGANAHAEVMKSERMQKATSAIAKATGETE